ncbi:hypothetical protein AB1N83_013723, partial [Pleurotus pulmonarius]
SATRLRSMAPA